MCTIQNAIEQYKEYKEAGDEVTPDGPVFVKEGGDITVQCDPTGWEMSHRGAHYTTVSSQ